MSRKLTTNGLVIKESLFCENYVGDCNLNATEAARKAKYKNPHVISAQLMDKPEIKAYIQRLLDESAMRSRLTADYVLAMIVSTLEKAYADNDHKIVLKASELLGKHLKLFTDVQEHKFTVNEMGKVVIEHDNGEQKPFTFDIGGQPNDIKQIN